jgi:hypothetical protein
LFDYPLVAMDLQSSPYSSLDSSLEDGRLNHMMFPQHMPLPQINTFNMTETDQLQYNTPRGDYLQTNPLAMNLTRPDMDMLMQDIDISNFSLADLDAFCSPQNPSKGMPHRYQRFNILTDTMNSQ